MTDATDELVGKIRENYARVLESVATSARRAGRAPEDVRVVVVTKSQPLAVVEAAIAAGVQILGENYVEEALAKIEGIRAKATSGAHDDNDAGMVRAQVGGVEWHMIGHIQSRKAKLLAPLFDMIHSLDSVKLAARLNELAGGLGRTIPVLLEFNVGGEPGKHGWPAADEAVWSQLLDEVEVIADMTHLKVCGLMTMPPLEDDQEAARGHFRQLRKLQEFLGVKHAQAGWHELSMGTSADFRIAVEEGATLVRVGEAILGPRPARERT